MVPVALQLFASRWPGIVGQGQDLPVNAGEHRIVERIQFLLRRLLEFEEILSHAVGRALADWPDIARTECHSLCAAIQKPDRPRSPPIWRGVFSSQFEQRLSAPYHRSQTGFLSSYLVLEVIAEGNSIRSSPAAAISPLASVQGCSRLPDRASRHSIPGPQVGMLFSTMYIRRWARLDQSLSLGNCDTTFRAVLSVRAAESSAFFCWFSVL